MGAMTGLLLLLWAGVTVGSVLDLQKRVVEGVDCPTDKRQYHVKLRSRKGTGLPYFCGGSLISDQWILTATHCWKREAGWTMTAHLNGAPAGGVVITEHVNYTDVNGTHDIMLLKLPDGTTHNIKPVKLPEDCPLKPGVDKVQVAGHGLNDVDTTKYNLKVWGKRVPLQCGDMTVAKCDGLRACLENNYRAAWNKRKHETWLCHEDKKVDVAKGDSGGGVVVTGTPDTIYGVISLGLPRACVQAAASMDVCHGEYLEWIKETIDPKPKQSGSG